MTRVFDLIAQLELKRDEPLAFACVLQEFAKDVLLPKALPDHLEAELRELTSLELRHYPVSRSHLCSDFVLRSVRRSVARKTKRHRRLAQTIIHALENAVQVESATACDKCEGPTFYILDPTDGQLGWACDHCTALGLFEPGEWSATSLRAPTTEELRRGGFMIGSLPAIG